MNERDLVPVPPATVGQLRRMIADVDADAPLEVLWWVLGWAETETDQELYERRFVIDVDAQYRSGPVFLFAYAPGEKLAGNVVPAPPPEPGATGLPG